MKGEATETTMSLHSELELRNLVLYRSDRETEACPQLGSEARTGGVSRKDTHGGKSSIH